MFETYLALGSALFGGAAVKIVDRFFFARTKAKEIEVDAAKQLRTELFAELAKMRVEIDKLNSDVDKWRSRFYRLYGIFSKLQMRFTLARAELLMAQGNASPHTIKELQRLMPNGDSSPDEISAMDQQLESDLDADLTELNSEVRAEGFPIIVKLTGAAT